LIVTLEAFHAACELRHVAPATRIPASYAHDLIAIRSRRFDATYILATPLRDHPIGGCALTRLCRRL
jgi:hypothetical protein